MARLQAQVDELAAASEVSSSAVAGLEATLAAVERAEARVTAGSGGQQLSASGSGGRRSAAEAHAAPSAGGGGITSAASGRLSRELVKAHTSAADAARKLRVAERCVAVACCPPSCIQPCSV